MDLNNFSISVNRITHDLFFYFSWVKVKRSELGLEGRETSPTFKRDTREALNLPATTTPHRRPLPTPAGRNFPTPAMRRLPTPARRRFPNETYYHAGK